MSLKIPEPAKGPLKKLLSLPREARRALVERVRSSPPALFIDDWAPKVAESFGVESKNVESIVLMLATLYTSQARFPEQSAEALASEVRDVAKESGDKDLADDSKWEELFPDLVALLSQDATLGVTAKAWDVLTSLEHNFQSARVITDLRPVFTVDLKPAVGVIVHNLIVTYIKDGREFEIVFGLDGNDVQSLQKVLNRASLKEASIKTLAQTAKLTVLERSK